MSKLAIKVQMETFIAHQTSNGVEISEIDDDMIANEFYQWTEGRYSMDDIFDAIVDVLY